MGRWGQAYDLRRDRRRLDQNSQDGGTNSGGSYSGFEESLD